MGRGQHRARSAQRDGGGKGAAMGRAALCMRAAALLAAAGMFIFLAEGISADNEIAEAVTARALKTTQINGTVPQDEYDTIFHIQWGGGSLYQLKARLATHGCMLDIVWVYDNEQWYPYSQYNVPHSLQQEFLTRYEDNIPAGTLYVTCYDLCTFKYTESALDQMEEELREKLERLQSSTLRQCRTTEQLRAGYRDTNPKKKRTMHSRLASIYKKQCISYFATVRQSLYL